jgi:hypothetical protein
MHGLQLEETKKFIEQRRTEWARRLDQCDSLIETILPPEIVN